jgi:arginyl-tRNA synthetase
LISSRIKSISSKAITKLYGDLDGVSFVVERPRSEEHGDFAINAPFLLARALRKKPVEIAEEIAAELRGKEIFERVEVAGPGFVNIFLSAQAWREELLEILSKGRAYASFDYNSGKKIQVEFVSANPVGPMHIGHGRWAAFGDTLARILERTGAVVTREFYINDAGRQMDVFAESVACRYSELYGENVPFPEDGYRGSYIYEIAKEISENYGNEFMELGFSDRKEKFKEVAYQMVLEHIKNVLIRMNVNFDIWFSERSLHLSGALEMAVKELESRGFVYEKDGALWFKSTAFGDEKDRVLVRSSGEPTYFLADIAYHINKKERGFDRVINIWGADHHGYVPRMMAAIRALGYEEDFLEIIIGQMVNLLSGGSPVRMSKRTGEMVTLEELLDEVGPDAIRFFFVSKSTDSTLDFDIELAKEQSQENPVYYVQYAHARICSILRKAEDDYGIRIEEDEPGGYIQLIGSKDEMRLISKLSVYPEIIDVSARTRDVHHLPAYLIDLASSFHSFYQKVRVITEDESLTRARLFLVKAVRDIMADGLDLLGVSAPEKM